MKIDYEYLESILSVFLESDKSFVTWGEFEVTNDGTAEEQEKFVFHIEIMADSGLIKSCIHDVDPNHLGIFRSNQGNGFTFDPNLPCRLTVDGHDFATELSKSTVLETIKKEFKEQGLSVVVEVAKRLAIKQAEKLLE